jgi:flavorubredoxin
METCIVYHSETGNTRRVAECLASATRARLVPVKDCACYTDATIYKLGAPRARQGERASIEPGEIDVSGCDMIVIGSPVWSWHPTPATNAAIAALKGCAGKRGIVFVTSGGKPGDTLEIMAQALEDRGVQVVGRVPFIPGDLEWSVRFTDLLDLVRRFSSTSFA